MEGEGCWRLGEWEYSLDSGLFHHHYALLNLSRGLVDLARLAVTAVTICLSCRFRKEADALLLEDLL